MSHTVEPIHALPSDIQKRLEELQHKDIEVIIHEICAKDRDNQFRRKVIVIELRDQSQNEQDKTSRKKLPPISRNLAFISMAFLWFSPWAQLWLGRKHPCQEDFSMLSLRPFQRHLVIRKRLHNRKS